MPSQRLVRVKPKSNPLALRHLEKVFSDRKLGFALRGTSWHEGINHRKSKPSLREANYVYQVPHANLLPRGRAFISQLRATILSVAQFSVVGKRDILAWRKWRHTRDYPAILIIRNQAGSMYAYRGGYDEAMADDYRDRNDGLGHKQLFGFPKETHAAFLPHEIVAIIRPTKREMKELEERLQEKYGRQLFRNQGAMPDSFRRQMINNMLRTNDGLMNGYRLNANDAFRRLMVSKTVQAIQRVYASEIEEAKKKK